MAAGMHRLRNRRIGGRFVAVPPRLKPLSILQLTAQLKLRPFKSRVLKRVSLKGAGALGFNPDESRAPDWQLISSNRILTRCRVPRNLNDLRRPSNTGACSI